MTNELPAMTPELLDEMERIAQARMDAGYRFGGASQREQLALVARIRELEAENADLRHDIGAYVEANSDLLGECDAARGRALEEAIALLPGGQICDPQEIADDIRALMESRK